MSKLVGKAGVVWAYAQEMFGAGLLHSVAACLLGIEGVSKFIADSAGDWYKVTLALFSASLALWSWYSNVASSEFGGYLRHKNQERMYACGIAWTLGLFFVATVTLICAKSINDRWVRNAAMFLLLYGGINVVTMTRNTLKLFELHGEFKQQMRLIEKEERGARQDT